MGGRETDAGLRYRLQLRNGVLTYTVAPRREAADVAVSLPRAALPALTDGAGDPERLQDAGTRIEGDAAVLSRLLAALEPPDPGFAIVTP